MPNLIIVSTVPADLAFASEVARAAALSLRIRLDSASAVPLVGPGDLLFADASAPESHASLKAALRAREPLAANSLHLIGDLPLDRTPHLRADDGFGHYLVRSYGDPVVAGGLYGRVLLSALGLAAPTDLFGGEPRALVFRDFAPSEKDRVLGQVSEFLLDARLESRIHAAVVNAADELLTNALFHAAAGAPSTVLEALSRTGPAHVEAHVSYDDEFLAIAVSDASGRVDKTRLLDRLARDHRASEYRFDRSAATAGLGLASIARAGGSLFILSRVGHRTIATALFRRAENFKDFRQQFRFISTQIYS